MNKIQITISDTTEKGIILISILFYVYVFGKCRDFFLEYRDEQYLYATLFLFPFVLLTQLKYLNNNISDYIRSTWRLGFIFCCSFFLISIIQTSYWLYIIGSSEKRDVKILECKIETAEGGFVARRSVGFKFNDKWHYKAVTEGVFQTIKLEGVENYCVVLAYYKAKNDLLIVENSEIGKCGEVSGRGIN